jgi:tetratricopeptide (TPR) repeat protein
MVAAADDGQRITQLLPDEVSTQKLQRNDPAKRDADGDSSRLPPSPFTTTSDVLKELNRALAALDPQDEDGGGDSRSSDAKPRFEIQKKFDNGSTRPATTAEVKSQDFQTKLKQTAQHLSTLSSDEERADFVQRQISYGNQLYESQQYEEAMDVYLTCMAGVETSSSPSQKAVLLCRLLHNLAQAALQLGWYAKSIRFCSIGLEQLRLEASKTVNSSAVSDSEDKSIGTSDVDSGRRQYAVKLYFKRGKAQRLKGNYADAQRDLKQAEAWVEGSGESPPAEQVRKAIRRELQLLSQAIHRGRENHQRQQSAMQQVLNYRPPERNRDPKSTDPSKVNPESVVRSKNSSDGHSSLYRDRIDFREAGKRSYSTLRAPSYYKNDILKDEEAPEATDPRLSCCQKVVRLLVSWGRTRDARKVD